MKLFDIIREMDGEEDGMKGLGRNSYDLTIQSTETQSAIDALNNIDNYGPYAQSMRDPEAIKKMFGPPNDNEKLGALLKQWDGLDKEKKEEKILDIARRHPEAFDKSKEEWETAGGEGDFVEYLISTENPLPKTLRGPKGKHYFPLKTPANLKKYSGKMEEGVHYIVNGDEITFPQKDSPFATKSYLEKVVKTIMDNAGVKYTVLKVEPKDTETVPGATKAAPSEATVSFKVTLDPAKIKGKRTETNGIIQRLKNTYDKNFEYSNNVITINKVKNQQVKLDLIKLFAPYALKATPTVNEEFLRMQKLAGVITEEEYIAEVKKDIPKGTQITYAPGKQPKKTAYMVEYTDHPYSQDWCMVSASEDLTEPFLVSKRWIK